MAPNKLKKLCLVSFLNAMAFTILIPIYVEAAKKYGITDSGVAILFGITAVGQFIATPVLGSVSDKIGRKPVLIFSIFGTLFASLLAAFSPNSLILFVSRFIDGATGGNSAIVQAMASDSSSKKDRVRAYSFFGAMFGAGIVVGPLLCALTQYVAFLLKVDGVTLVFLLSASVSLLSLVFVYLGINESLPNQNKQKDLKIGRAFKNIFTSLSDKNLSRFYILTFASALALYMFTSSLTQYVKNALFIDTKTGILAVIIAFLGLIGALSQFLLIHVVASLGIKQATIITFILRAVLLLALGIFTNIYAFAFIITFLALVNNSSVPLLGSYVSLSTEADRQGVNNSINVAWFYFASIFGSAAAAALIRAFPQNLGLPFIASGILVVLASILASTLLKNFKTNVS